MPDIPQIPDEALQNQSAPTLYQASVENSQSRDNEFLAKAAMFTVGLHGLGRLFGKNIFASLADMAGSMTRNVAKLGKPVNKIPAFVQAGLHSTSAYRSTAIGSELANGTALSSFALVQDLAHADYLLSSNRYGDVAAQLTSRLRDNFAAMSTKAPGANLLHQGFQKVTIGDVLDNPSLLRGGDTASSAFELKILERSVQRGLVSKSQALDNNLFIDETGKLVDSRMLRPGFMLDAVSEVFNPFGLFSSLKSFAASERTVGIVSSRLKNASEGVFIGGDVYEYINSGLARIARGQTLTPVSGARYLPSVLREAPSLIKESEPTPGMFGPLQDKLGIGPAFHERKTGALSIGLTFFKNVIGIATGRAKFFARDYKSANASLLQSLAEPYTFEGATASGQEIVRGKYFGKGVMSYGDFRTFTGFYDRLKAYAGLSSDVSIVTKEAAEGAIPGVTKLTRSDFYTQFGRSGIESTEKVIAMSKTPTGIQLSGELDYAIRPSDFAASADVVDQVYDFANWMTLRLNKLASASLLGIGFKPSSNLFVNTARVAAIPALYHFGKEATMYANYLIGQVAGQGPIEYAADLYTNLRVGQQKAREKLGITEFAEDFERTLPGLDLGVMGTLGAVVAGIKGAEFNPLIGLLTSGIIYAGIGGPDVKQSAESLEREYAGEEKVPIRKNRWWLLGYTPFAGNQIDFYDFSWYRRLKDKPYDINLYGSEEGYWKYGSSLPTPSNLFGLSTLIDPYKLERQNYYDRPYPTTAKMFEEVPIVGPILADTIGEIIKPTKRMHEAGQLPMVATSNITQRGVPTNAARELGLPDLPVSVVDLSRPDVAKDRLDKYMNVGLEPTGIWKFALELFGVKFGEEFQLASANNMDSISRRFYEMNLGGLFGETEFIRRFLLSDYGQPSKINQQINPISNTMPRWLPGSESEFEKDRQNFIDFSKGDAFTKIPKGEYRLPGRGYEAMNRLYSGVAGVYSDVDKFLILSDVAPFSQAYYSYEGIVSKMDLSPYWAWKVRQAKDYRESKRFRFTFEQANQEQKDIAMSNESSFARNLRQGWTGFSQQGLANIPIVGAKLFPYRNAYDQYLADVVEGDVFADWSNPFETIVRPAFYTTIGESPLFAVKRGIAMGSLMASPMGAFLNPFPAITANPIASSLIGGAVGGIGSTARMLSTGSFSHGFVPPHVQKERESEEYFDYLKYVKYRGLEGLAQEQGNQRLASIFASQARQTRAYGLAQYETTGKTTALQASLSRQERPYFDAFLQAPEKYRSEILKVVPDYMKPVLKGEWTKGQNEVIEVKDSKASRQAYGVADEAAINYFDQNALPSPDWQGWNPTVPDVAIKVKALQGHINGVSDAMHRFGIYPAQVREARIRFPELDAPQNAAHDSIHGDSALIMSNLFGKEHGNPFTSAVHRKVSHGVGPRVDWFNVDLQDQRRDQVFAFYNDAYR